MFRFQLFCLYFAFCLWFYFQFVWFIEYFLFIYLFMAAIKMHILQIFYYEFYTEHHCDQIRVDMMESIFVS